MKAAYILITALLIVMLVASAFTVTAGDTTEPTTEPTKEPTKETTKPTEKPTPEPTVDPTEKPTWDTNTDPITAAIEHLDPDAKAKYKALEMEKAAVVGEKTVSISDVADTSKPSDTVKIKIIDKWIDKDTGVLKVKAHVWINGYERQIHNPVTISNPPVRVPDHMVASVEDKTVQAMITREDASSALNEILYGVALKRSIGEATFEQDDPDWIGYSIYDGYVRNTSPGVNIQTKLNSIGDGAYDYEEVTYVGYRSSNSLTNLTYDRVWRGIETFDTSSLLSTYNVDSGYLYHNYYLKSSQMGCTTIEIVGGDPISFLKYDTTYDYPRRTKTLMADNITTDNITVAKYFGHKLTANGINKINKSTGGRAYTAFFIVIGFDILEIDAPCWKPYQNLSYVQLYTNESTKDPFLLLSYSIPPVSAFTNNTAYPLSGTAPLTVQFQDESTNTPTTWNWSWSNVSTPGIWTVFNQSQNGTAYGVFGSGCYDINLTVSNVAGSDEEVKSNYVCVITPEAGAATAHDELPWCDKPDLFFWWNDTGDITNYRTMNNVPEIRDQIFTQVTVDQERGPAPLGCWSTPAAKPGVTWIAPGIWRFRTYHNVSSAVGNSYIQFQVFNRSLDGTETDLFYGLILTKEINTLTTEEYLTSYAKRNWTKLFTGDRLVIKAFGCTTSVNARTISMALAGNTNASMVSMGWLMCDDDCGSSMIGLAGSGALPPEDDTDMLLMAAITGGMVAGVTVAYLFRKRGNQNPP